jgi:hypothetical protein
MNKLRMEGKKYTIYIIIHVPLLYPNPKGRKGLYLYYDNHIYSLYAAFSDGVFSIAATLIVLDLT